MSGAVNPIPEGYHTITPYLFISGAAEAIEFYKTALGATEIMRMPGPNGTVGHAELMIGDSQVMLAEECPQMNAHSAKTLGGSPVMLHVYVDNVDAWAERAVAAGMTVKRPVEDQFYGDRAGCFEDPFGLSWYLSSHVQDIPEDEIHRRAAEMAEQYSGA